MIKSSVLFFLVFSLLLFLIPISSAIVIDNATTAGFTTANVSLNGSSWTGQNGGGLRLNYRNDSSLNMSGLVAVWNFDEQSGTIVHNVMNESGLVNLTNQGTLVNMNSGLNNCTGNCSGWNSSGKIGNALTFDGVDDYVNAGNNASLSFSKTTAFSGSACIFSQNIGVIQYILAKQMITAPYAGYSFLISSSGKLWVELGDTNQITKRVDSSVTLQNNTWYFVAFTYDGSNDASGIKIYVNGIDRTGTILINEAFTADILVTNPFQIGVRDTTYKPFNGRIDEVRIWNRNLSASEIAVAYNTSMRTQAMPVIMNQTASAGKKINKVRINYTGQDTLNNISIYVNKSGIAGRTLFVSNATPQTWYIIPASLENQTMDFGLFMQGNGSLTPFFTSLEYDEASGQQNPFVAVGVAAMGVAVSIAIYNMYRRRGRPSMMFIPGLI